MANPLVRLNDYARLGAAALTAHTSGKPSVSFAKSEGTVTPGVAQGELPAPRGRTVKPVRGTPNGTEKRYMKRLDNRILAGEVAAYWYEAVKFRLADGSWFCPDFLVLMATGMLELHETKGGFTREAALVRLKVTSETFWAFPVKLVKEKPINVFTITEVSRS